MKRITAPHNQPPRTARSLSELRTLSIKQELTLPDVGMGRVRAYQREERMVERVNESRREVPKNALPGETYADIPTHAGGLGKPLYSKPQGPFGDLIPLNWVKKPVDKKS